MSDTTINPEIDPIEKRGPSGFAIAAGLVALAALCVGLAAFFFSFDPSEPAQPPLIFEPITRQTVNLVPDGFLDTDITLKLKSEAARTTLRQHMPEVSSIVGGYLSTLDKAEAQGGFAAIERGIADRLSPILGPDQVDRVLFQSFVIQ